MAINLDQVRQDESAELGNVTVGTDLSSITAGDVSGSLNSGLSVTGLRGVNLDNTGTAQNNEAYVRLTAGADFTRQRVVLFNETTSSGTVQGDYDGGLDLVNIYNATINPTAPSFTASGEGLVYDGADFFEIRQLNPSRNLYVNTATATAQNNDKIIVDSTTQAVTITPPSSPVNGNNFTVYFLKADAATPIVNTVTVSFGTPFVFNKLGSVTFVRVDNAWIPQNIGAPVTP